MIEEAPTPNFENKVVLNLSNPKVMGKIKDLNNNYLYWDKIKYKKINDFTPNEIWSTVKLVRSINKTEQKRLKLAL